MPSINDYIISAIGGSDLNASLISFFQDNGATATSFNDAAIQFLEAKGYTTGAVSDRMYAWLGDLGYTGDLSDRWLKFWMDGGSLVILSNLVVTPLSGGTTASISVDVDSAEGDVYFVVVPAGSAVPDADQIVAGTDGDDTAATWTGTAEVTSIDTYVVGPTGLTAATDYTCYAVHVNDSLVKSNIVTDDFTTEAVSFAPTDLASLELWLDASDTTGMWQENAKTTAVTAANDPVAVWTDKSTNAYETIQPTASDRPLLQQDGSGNWYLDFDGSNDWLQIATFDMSATEEVTVCVGFYNEDAGTNKVLCELTGNANTTTGGFKLAAYEGTTSQGNFAARGDTDDGLAADDTAGTPAISVFTGTAKISTDEMAIRLNGVETDANTTVNMGGGNFASSTLNIGARVGGAQLLLGGRIYQMVICSAVLTGTDLSNLESYVAAKAGVTI